MKLRINGKYYLYFNDFTISTTLDSVASTFAFTLKRDFKNLVQKDLTRPLAFHQVELFDDFNKLLLNGTIINNGFNSSAAPNLVQLSGYSAGGVLEDCTIDYALYPLESINRTLKEIAERLLKSFGLKLIIAPNVKDECNKPYTKSVAEPDGTIKDYLAKLAAQRNIVLSHDIYGNIIFFKPNIKAQSLGLFTAENTLNMSLDVNGQGMHSKITTIRQPSKKSTDLFSDESGVTGVDTENNPLIQKHRPFVEVMSSGSDTDTSKSAKNTLAAELKGIKVTLDLDRWIEVMAGDIIEVMNEEIFLYAPTRLMIESMTKFEDSGKKGMSLSLVLPETFTGDTPKNIFI